MRIFLVLLANMYLHSHDYRCNFQMRICKARTVVSLAPWTYFPYEGMEEIT